MLAERLKEKLLEEEKIVDLVVGPDAYKDFPKLLEEIEKDREAINVILSKEETYGDINPVRINSNGVGAFVSIMRGCDNMCMVSAPHPSEDIEEIMNFSIWIFFSQIFFNLLNFNEQIIFGLRFQLL